MDRFYYDLLNIGKMKTNYDDYFKNIEKIIEEETCLAKKDNPSLDRLCKVISNNINIRLKELNYDSKIVNTKEIYDMYEHQFILSSYIDNNDNMNYVLIDPTYKQFNYQANILKVKEDGNLLLNNLLNNGCSIINDNDLKRYIGSIMHEDNINKIDITISDIVLERRK